MRLFNILFPLTTLACLVLASPIEERGTGLTAVESAVTVPNFQKVDAEVNAGGTVAHIEGGNEGGNAATIAPGVSKRSDYNGLDERSTRSGTLILCTGYGCGGSCYGYSLPVRSNVCYGSIAYNSVYVRASTGLAYGVYVGRNCYGPFWCYTVFRARHLIAIPDRRPCPICEHLLQHLPPWEHFLHHLKKVSIELAIFVLLRANAYIVLSQKLCGTNSS